MSDHQAAMERLFGKPTKIVMSRVPDGRGGTFWTVASLFEDVVQSGEFVLEIGKFSRESFIRAAEFAKAFDLAEFWDDVTTGRPIQANIYPDSEDAFDYARALIEMRCTESVFADTGGGTTRNKI